MPVRRFPVLMCCVLVATPLSGCGGGAAPAPQSARGQYKPARQAHPGVTPTKPELAPPPTAPQTVAEKVAQFAPAELTADLSVLPDSERKALDLLIEAARHLDPLFDIQAYASNPQLEAELAQDKSPEGQAKLAYFKIMRGPWDRQDHHTAFATDKPHPKGAGFYPEDLTAEAFDAYVAAHKDQAQALQSLTTVVARSGEQLTATPYSEAYKQWLDPAAERLREAAKTTKNASLATFLRSRADAFASDDYYQSDKDWMDLDSLVEITIGPYETYEDQLKGLKASFEAFVTVSDPKASKDLERFKGLLPEMEQNLPIADEMKTVRGSESPIRVVDLVFTAGDARKSVQTIAFNLPNDERVRKEKGAKKVLLRNLIRTKFEKIMRPIGERIIDPNQIRFLSSEAFFQEVLFHELSHSLGPAFTEKDGEQVEVRVALGANYSAIEEAKADVMGAYNVLFMIKKGEFPEEMRKQLLVSYFAGLFRSVRFGVAEAHGKGAAMQINYFLDRRVVSFDESTNRFSVDFIALEKGISQLVNALCTLQHRGDTGGVEAMLTRYGKRSPPISAALAQLGSIPVDIRPIYPVAGESGR